MIKILHLYKNLMNLYGEYGNIKVLAKHLKDQNINVTIDVAESLNNINLNDYNMLYIGSGTEDCQKLALKDFIQYKEMVQDFINNNNFTLLTGNSFEMLGTSITDSNGNKFSGLNIQNFKTVEQNKKRLTSDVIANCDFLKKPIVGFINKASTIYNTEDAENYFSKIKMGFGNNNKSDYEGIKYKNLIGTHIIGPILVKNPELLNYVVLNLAKSISKENNLKKINYSNEEKAYNVTYEKLYERLNKQGSN